MLRRLLTEFAVRQPAIAVRTVCGASDELADHLLHGIHVDLFLSAEVRQLDRLAAAHLLAAETRNILATNRLAAVALPSSVPDLRGPRGLLQPRMRRIALAHPSCPLGGYTRSYLEPLGIWPEVCRRAMFLDNPRVVLAAVESGQADAGIVYDSDAGAAAHCRILFRSQTDRPSISYTAVLTHWGERSPSARALLAYLGSAAAQSHFRSAGFRTVQPSRRDRG